MAKRRVDSQIGNLTRNHKNSGIALISLRASSVRHTVGKLLTRATKKNLIHLNRRSTHKVMGLESCKSPNFGNFETPTWDNTNLWKKKICMIIIVKAWPKEFLMDYIDFFMFSIIFQYLNSSKNPKFIMHPCFMFNS